MIKNPIRAVGGGAHARAYNRERSRGESGRNSTGHLGGREMRYFTQTYLKTNRKKSASKRW